MCMIVELFQYEIVCINKECLGIKNAIAIAQCFQSILVEVETVSLLLSSNYQWGRLKTRTLELRVHVPFSKKTAVLYLRKTTSHIFCRWVRTHSAWYRKMKRYCLSTVGENCGIWRGFNWFSIYQFKQNFCCLYLYYHSTKYTKHFTVIPIIRKGRI